mgnify:CR=1 FL=1
MRHILSTTALLLLLAAPLSAHAQETRYRVEVIVLTHLGHTETAREVAMLRDYGDALDFLAPADTPAAEDDEAAGQTPEVAAQDELEAESAEAPGAGEESADAATPAVVHIEQLGEVMQDAWRRLRLSGPFRPVVSLAWEQGSAWSTAVPVARALWLPTAADVGRWTFLETTPLAGLPLDHIPKEPAKKSCGV